MMKVCKLKWQSKYEEVKSAVKIEAMKCQIKFKDWLKLKYEVYDGSGRVGTEWIWNKLCLSSWTCERERSWGFLWLQMWELKRFKVSVYV